MARSEYEMAVKIAGQIEQSFYNSTRLTKKELRAIAKEAAATKASVPAQIKQGLSDAKPAFDGLERVAKTAFTGIVTAATIAGSGIAAGIVGSISAGSEFESAFAGVKKTVNATSAELNEMRDDIRDMAKDMPQTASELSEIAESAGQLGIQTPNIVSFTRTIADLKEATNLGDEGASEMAQFANITGMAQDQFDRLGSSIVALGNNTATTEADIMGMGMRIAAAGTQVKLSQADIMGYSAALASVGIEAEAGGSAFSKLLVNLQLAAETGKGLSDYAAVAGMTGSQFKKAFQEDATTAINAFLGGLNDTERNGKSAIAVLTDMGITEVRLRDTLLRAANASGMFGDTLQISNQAWKENIALTNEAEQRYKTMESQADILKNKITDIGIENYDEMRPALTDLLGIANEFVDEIAGEDAIGDWIRSFNKNLPTMVRQTKQAAASVKEFAGPFLQVGGWLADNPGVITGAIVGIGSSLMTYKVASGVMSLATSLGALGPAGLAILGIGGAAAVITGISTAVKKSAADAKNANLARHFGDISLSLDDLQEAAESIIKSKDLDKVRTALSAFDEVKDLDESISDTVREIQKSNWKVSIGMDLSDQEKQEYQDNIAAFVQETQDYVSQKQYAVSLAIGVLSDGDLQSQNMIDQVNQFYSGKQAQLAALGKELNEAITDAFQDGLLDIDEAARISQIQQQMADVKAALASSEFDAQMDLLGMKYGGDLDADSFKNLQAELTEQVNAATADYDEAFVNARAAQGEMLKAGEITQAQYDSNVESLEENYRNQIADLQSRAAQFQTQTIMNQYADEIGGLEPQISQQLRDVLGDALQYIDTTGNAVGGWDAKTLLSEMGIDSLSSDTRDALRDLWEELKPQAEDMQALAAQYTAAGQEIPESLSKGISEAATIGIMAGDEEAMYAALGEAARDSEEYQETLKTMQEQGTYIPEELAQAIGNNKEPVRQAAQELFAVAQEAASGAFGNGLDINVRANVRTATGNISQAPATNKGLAPTAKLRGHAEGGIFDTPHIAWFAEKGPEAAIPLDGSQNAADLWRKTGQLLNMPGLSGGQQENAALEQVLQTSGAQFMFAPVINITGSGLTKEDVQEALETEEEHFAALMNRWQKNNGRLSFG
ncbi:MAG: phage tail tape measure protein [Eubacteriales bacterium]|nr:phage tail tape measure protein [Eubacteriales bacterium]